MLKLHILSFLLNITALALGWWNYYYHIIGDEYCVYLSPWTPFNNINKIVLYMSFSSSPTTYLYNTKSIVLDLLEISQLGGLQIPSSIIYWKCYRLPHASLAYYNIHFSLNCSNMVAFVFILLYFSMFTSYNAHFSI